VTCTDVQGDDRGVVTAYGIPFNRYSQTKNRVRFSLRDMAGNTGLSPVYIVRGPVSSQAPPQVSGFTASAGSGAVVLVWTNPADLWFSGTMIRYKTSGYPTGPTDGILLCDTAAAPGSADSSVHSGLSDCAYYYAAFAHNETPLYASGALAAAELGQVAQVEDDGAWTPSLSKLHFSFDPVACAGEYHYAVGTTSGGTEARAWTSCGQATDVVATGLSLTENQTYYISVQVGTGNGTWGASTTSDGITVAPGIGIPGAKALPDGTSSNVYALRGVTVSARFTGFFYVQEDVYCGIRVLSNADVSEGDAIDICGVMEGSDAERYMDCTGNPVFQGE
jgi:hypothetical protein